MLKVIKNKSTGNRRNGFSAKTQLGELPIEVSRDGNGKFEPIVVLSIKETYQVLKKR